MPSDLTAYHLAYIVRKRLKFKEHDALFLYCGNILLKSDSSMIQVYNSRKDPDGFLYLTYAQETVFGSDKSRGATTSYNTNRLLIE